MLSVILPSYNHAPYLGAALDALLAQTRPADEIVIIDDASTDESAALAAAYAARHSAIRLIRNSRNLGCVPNLNRGLAAARGDVVYCGAADDLTYPTLFAQGLALLDAHPRAAMFSARSDIIDATGRRSGTIPTPLPLAAAGYIDPPAAARFLMREDGWFIGNTALYRRAALVARGGFPEDLDSFTDGYVSRVLALEAGACFSPEILAAWRRLEGGYAWSQTVALEQRDRLIATAMRRMSDAASPFPAGYARRWRGRFVFGADRFGLAAARRQAAAGGATARAAGVAREAVGTAWLFLRWRPWDAVPVARRQWRYWREQRRGRRRPLSAAPSRH